MHYMEDILPKEISDIFAPGEVVSRIYPPDQCVIETGVPPVKPWYTIQDMAYEKRLIKDGYIGKCRYMFLTYSMLSAFTKRSWKSIRSDCTG